MGHAADAEMLVLDVAVKNTNPSSITCNLRLSIEGAWCIYHMPGKFFINTRHLQFSSTRSASIRAAQNQKRKPQCPAAEVN
jgi:hypothetical protein